LQAERLRYLRTVWLCSAFRVRTTGRRIQGSLRRLHASLESPLRAVACPNFASTPLMIGRDGYVLICQAGIDHTADGAGRLLPPHMRPLTSRGCASGLQVGCRKFVHTSSSSARDLTFAGLLLGQGHPFKSEKSEKRETSRVASHRRSAPLPEGLRAASPQPRSNYLCQ
jgi:hypothetical protein